MVLGSLKTPLSHPDLTTCDWTDEFCDCRDLGTIYSLITEEELCARHYWKRLAQLPTAALDVGLKKPPARADAPDCRTSSSDSLKPANR